MWGSGTPLREFMHVDDLGDASLFLMNQYNETGFINVGSGIEISILHLAELVKEIVGFKGSIIQDTSKPDGTPRKLMDNTRLTQLGWKSTITLEEGIRSVYAQLTNNDWY